MNAFFFRPLLWMGILILLSTACKDDEDPVTPSDRLVGTWTLQSYDTEVTINNQDYVAYIQQLPDLSDQEKAFAIALVELQIQHALEDINIPVGTTFQFKSDKNYEVKVPNEAAETGQWMLNTDGTILTIDEGTQEEIAFEVDTLTETSLVLSIETTEQDDIDQDGEVDTLVAKFILNLSK